MGGGHRSFISLVLYNVYFFVSVQRLRLMNVVDRVVLPQIDRLLNELANAEAEGRELKEELQRITNPKTKKMRRSLMT